MSDVAIARPQAGLRLLPRMLVQSFLAQWVLFVVPALYLASNAALLSGVEGVGRAPVGGLLFEMMTFALPLGLVSMLLLRLVQYAVILKPESPTRQLLIDVRELVARPARILVGIPVFAAMIAFNKAMIELKPAIPKIIPFSWDEWMMQADRALHFGADPWVLLQPLLGHDLVTFAINLAYNFWFVILGGAWFWFGFQCRSNELRTRFFLSYMLSWWVGGGLLAVYFSSAGPVYYTLVGLSPDPYQPLMAYLADVNTRLPIWILDAQRLLWDGYTGKADAIGISAFPSMHNASALIFAFAFSQVNRKAGWFFYGYAAVILVGSVHSGWHYAVDGYAGLAIAWASWAVAGVVARWHGTRAEVAHLNKSLASL